MATRSNISEATARTMLIEEILDLQKRIQRHNQISGQFLGMLRRMTLKELSDKRDELFKLAPSGNSGRRR